jgi:hypothetical protein
LDGIDIVTHLREQRASEPRTLFWRQRRGENTWRGVRAGDLKLVSRQEGADRQDWLFDLAADVAEKNDLAAARPAELKQMQDRLSSWEADVKPSR